jgi:phospholipase/carboxylesterase
MLKNAKVIKSEIFKKADRILVTLHGYGSCGNDFAEVGEIFLAKQLDNTIFLFPDAPYNCEIGFGKQWFPLNKWTSSDKISYEELRKGLNQIGPILHNYLVNSSQKYECKNINLIGFSQGTILALEMLYYPGITKIIGYSGAFAMPKEKPILSNKADVLIVHSDDDAVVPYSNATSAQKNLTSLGIKSELKTYHNIGHSISLEGWQYGIEFLRR